MTRPLVYVVIADGGELLAHRAMRALRAEFAADLGEGALFDVAATHRVADAGSGEDRPALIAVSTSPLARLTMFLAGLVAQRHPVSAERALRLGLLVRRMAEESDVPPERALELERAALLFEVGRLVLDDPDPPPAEILRATRVALRGFPECAPICELIENVAENWDGTGLPGRKVKGQIPYRARVLRVAADFLEILDRGGTAIEAMGALSEHVGTHYDPRPVAALMGLIEKGVIEITQSRRRYVAVEELEPGMRLAEDLFSEGGVMLLVADSVVTESMLSALRERQATDPVPRAVAIQADAA